MPTDDTKEKWPGHKKSYKVHRQHQKTFTTQLDTATIIVT